MASKDKRSLYVFALGLPAANASWEIKNIDPSKIKRVSVVGSGAELPFTTANNVLTIETPAAPQMDKIATVFKIEMEL